MSDGVLSFDVLSLQCRRHTPGRGHWDIKLKHPHHLLLNIPCNVKNVNIFLKALINFPHRPLLSCSLSPFPFPIPHPCYPFNPSPQKRLLVEMSQTLNPHLAVT